MPPYEMASWSSAHSGPDGFLRAGNPEHCSGLMNQMCLWRVAGPPRQGGDSSARGNAPGNSGSAICPALRGRNSVWLIRCAIGFSGCALAERPERGGPSFPALASRRWRERALSAWTAHAIRGQRRAYSVLRVSKLQGSPRNAVTPRPSCAEQLGNPAVHSGVSKGPKWAVAGRHVVFFHSHH